MTDAPRSMSAPQSLRIDGLKRRMRDRIREFAHVYGRCAAPTALRIGQRGRGQGPRSRGPVSPDQARAATELFAHGSLSVDTVETIHLLPATDRIFLLECASITNPETGVGRLIEWLGDESGHGLGDFPELPSDEEVRRIAGC